MPTLTKKDIERLSKSGVRFLGSNGQPIIVKSEIKRAEAPKESEIPYLRSIKETLIRILEKPQPTIPTMQSPDVIVNPPEVVVPAAQVNIPPPLPRIRKWHFDIKRDFQGYTTEITATALE